MLLYYNLSGLMQLSDKHGWSKDENSGCLSPRFAPFNTLHALDEMLKFIKVSYEQRRAAMYMYII